MGTLSMIVFAIALMGFRLQLGAMFSLDPEVILLTSMAVPMLAVSLIGKLGVLTKGCERQVRTRFKL